MYYLATDEQSVFHYGKMEEGQVVKTGQPKIFYYNTEQKLITALTNYGQQYKPTVIIIT